MQTRKGSSRSCVRRALLLAALSAVLTGCSKKEARVGMWQEFRMGPFTVKAVSLETYSRAHQGVPFEVAVRLRCTGGNRFDRLDFQDMVSYKGPAYLTTSSGWRDRVWVLARGDRAEDFLVLGNPPLGSSGFALEIGNPYAKGDEPNRYVVDLGK